MVNKNFLFLFVFLMLSVSLVSSAQITNVNSATGLQVFAPELKAVRYNTTYNLHLHVSNISTGLTVPNNLVDCYVHMYDKTGSHIFQSEALEKSLNGQDLEQTILYDNFTEHGENNVFYIWCNTTSEGGEVKGIYEVTANGKPTPEGIVIISFSLILILMLSYSVVMIVKAMGHIIDKDFDLMDLALMWGAYFGLLAVTMLANIYMGNVEVNTWLNLFVSIYAFPMVILPIIALLLSIFNMNKKAKEKANRW